MADDQSGTLAFLGDPSTYGEPPGGVRRIDTHISAVFLAGDRAYKLKRAVAFPYLDFSTVERRQAACAAELAVNRRTAPDLYLEIRPIVRRDGGLAFGVPGESAVDWVVVMRRFPDDGLWDARAAAGTIDLADVRDLADGIAAFHEHAEATPGYGGVADLAWTADGDRADLARHFPPEAVAALDRDTRAALARHADLIARRAAQGAVRRCHGDLHLRNVATVDGRPLPFDAIEFEDRIACIDTLFDLAFLIVDWLPRGPRRFRVHDSFTLSGAAAGRSGACPAAAFPEPARGHQGEDARGRRRARRGRCVLRDGGPLPASAAAPACRGRRLFGYGKVGACACARGRDRGGTGRP